MKVWLQQMWRHWWVRIVVVVVCIGVVIGFGLSYWMATQTDRALELVAQISEPEKRLTAYRELAQFQVDGQAKIWTTIVQAIGAVVLAVGGYFTYSTLRVGQQNLEVAHENLRVSERKLEIDRDGQVTNRITQAVAQLGSAQDGSPNLEVRLGGIYALESIARDSIRDRQAIMEILTAYVRRNAPWSPSSGVDEPSDDRLGPIMSPAFSGLRIDIQAVLTVIGRRRSHPGWEDATPLDLSGTNLQRASLKELHLEGVMFMRANLQQANFLGAHLEEAKFVEAHLKWAELSGAHLERAMFVSANLDEVFFFGAHLEGANFGGADLTGANFSHANVRGAGFGAADVSGTKFADAIGLTRNQLQMTRRGGSDVASLPAFEDAEAPSAFDSSD